MLAELDRGKNILGRGRGGHRGVSPLTFSGKRLLQFVILGLQVGHHRFGNNDPENEQDSEYAGNTSVYEDAYELGVDNPTSSLLTSSCAGAMRPSAVPAPLA